MKVSFNKSTDQPRKSGRKYDPIPRGVYRLAVVDIETRTPKKGGPEYLSATFEVETGDFAGRRVWDSFYVNHPKAAAISLGRLEDLAQSCGVPPIDGDELECDELTGHVCVAKVDIEEREGFDPRNQIKRYIVPKAKKAAPQAEPDPLADEIPF